MNPLKHYFYVITSDDKMLAEIHCLDVYENEELQINRAHINEFLRDQGITYGIDDRKILFMLSKVNKNDFPITIANGIPPIDGKDGHITYELDFSSKVDRTAEWSFRDVMRIPSIGIDQKLATNTLPTSGTEGFNVFGKVLTPKKGKPVQIKPGKNVEYRKEELSYYATSSGQVSITNHSIHVHSVYEVNESLSMKTGNINFIGSVIIRGDVLAGYKVKAEGDIKIFGIVEAAEIIAGGSIYISEGLAGMKKGFIKAGEDIHLGYINQGIARAENDIYVNNSIIHSDCVAGNNLLCKHGNIIGGSLTAGKTIEAKDIGNRLSTITTINIGLNKNIRNLEDSLLKKRNELKLNYKKLEMIGKQLEEMGDIQDAKLRITILRQKNSQKKNHEQIKNIDNQLFKIKTRLNSKNESILTIMNVIYPNVLIAFGKYIHKIDKVHKNVNIFLDQKVVSVRPIS